MNNNQIKTWLIGNTIAIIALYMIGMYSHATCTGLIEGTQSNLKKMVEVIAGTQLLVKKLHEVLLR